MAVQLIRPISDVVSVGWAATPSSPATGWDKVDEAVADDSDYFSSGLAPDGSEPWEVALSSASDPLNNVNHIFRYRIRKNAAAGAQLNVDVELLDGAVVIETWNHVDVGNAWTTHEQTLGATKADNITNYGNLRLRFTPTQV